MTWVFLTDTERNKISRESGPYIVDGWEPHEAAVRKANPRNTWHGLSADERKAIMDAALKSKPIYMSKVYATVEEKLKEKNHG
jgi:predicted Fe-S protein YdhL (DUF1289 family)